MKKKEKKQKIKKERKPMSNTDKFMLVFLATLIIYLAIILPIRLCVVSFSWHWFVFGFVAIVIPFAFIHFQLWSQKKLSFTDEQKKNANIVTVKYILYFWFLDCLYMAIFNQWKLWIYILGIITLIKIFYGLTVTFLGKKQKNAILDISIVFDFLLGVGLTVYLIYLIPDKFNNLQTIFTAIVAAVYGGLLTLIGVAWTIRKGDKDRKDELERRDKEKAEEERKKYRPFFIVMENNNNADYRTIDKSIIKTNDNFSYVANEICTKPYQIKEWFIRNTDFNSFAVFGFKFNDILVKTSPYRFVYKESVIKIDIPMFYISEEIKSVSMLVIDMLDKVYEISLGGGFKEQDAITYVQVWGNGRPKLLDMKVDII